MIKIISWAIGSSAVFCWLGSCRTDTTLANRWYGSQQHHGETMESSDGLSVAELNYQRTPNFNPNLKSCVLAMETPTPPCQPTVNFICSVQHNNQLISGTASCSYLTATQKLYQSLCDRNLNISDESLLSVSCSVTSLPSEQLVH